MPAKGNKRDPKREAKIITALEKPGATFKSVGRQFGLSGERIRQIELRYLGEAKTRILNLIKHPV